MDPVAARTVRLRHRRHLAPAHPYDDVHGHHRRRLVVPGHRSSSEGVLHPAAAPPDGHDRHLLCARFFPLLRLLGNHARADVLHHRHLGRTAETLRRDQVLHLHAVGISGDAVVDPGALLLQRRWYSVSQHSGSWQRPDVLRFAVSQHRTPHPADAAVLDLPRFLPGVCDQSPDVSFPHLASRRARGSPHGRLDHPCRRPPENGYLRFRALRSADSSGRHEAVAAVDRRAFDHRHHLRCARVACAERHEKARRLFIGLAPGLRHAWNVCPQSDGPQRLRAADDQPRHFDRRALPARRYHLRAAPHADDCGLRRAGQADAGLRDSVPHRRALVDGTSGAERLRR